MRPNALNKLSVMINGKTRSKIQWRRNTYQQFGRKTQQAMPQQAMPQQAMPQQAMPQQNTMPQQQAMMQQAMMQKVQNVGSIPGGKVRVFQKI